MSGTRGPLAPRPWMAPLAVAVAGFLLYVPGLDGGFLRDDHFLIERHPFLRADGWLGALLLGDFWAPVSGATGMWRPLVVLSYWVDGRLGGWDPFWFHVVNAAAHALASGALAGLVAAAGGGVAAAAAAGLVFATMPAHAECVAWISGRTDVFCALFGVLALWFDHRAHRAGRRWPGFLACTALVLALLSKEVGVTLGGVLAVMEWIRMREAGTTPLRAVWWLAPYAVITGAYLAAHGVFAPDPGLISAPELQQRAAHRGAAWALFPGYLAYLWPWFPHSPDRAAPTLGSTPAAETAIGAACAVGVGLVFLWSLVRRARLAVPLALALLPLVPPLVLASTRGYGLYGERHIYVSSAGLAWAFGLGLSALAARGRGRAGGWVAGLLAGVLVAGGAVETLRALPAYRDDATMYRTMIEREPTNPIGFVGLAGAQTEQGLLDEAAALLEQAGRVAPELPSVYVGRARVASRREAWPAVLAETERALALDPRLQSAQLLRAVALMRLRRLPEAGEVLRGLRDEYPGHPEVGTVWGQYLLTIGRDEEALPVLESAAALLPAEPSLWDAIGVANTRLGRPEVARAAFERAVALAPGYAEGWRRLAATCRTLGDSVGYARALARAAALSAPAERRGSPAGSPPPTPPAAAPER